jgi:hypothetical protein
MTETRYFRSDWWTVNYITAYKWIPENSVTSAYKTFFGGQLGIRVYRRSTTVKNYEITSGVSANVTYTGDGWHSATWDCPWTAFDVTDCVLIRFFYYYAGAWNLLTSFVSEQLNAVAVNASTWICYYYLSKSGSTYYFYFGSAMLNSRVENFQWTPLVTKSWHDIDWIFTFSTMQWSSILWNFDLKTRQWNSITWSFDFITKTWNSIQWVFNLDTKQWNEILWVFILNKIEWHSIYWYFGLNPEVSIPVLFIGIVFLGLISCFIIAAALKKRK